MIKNQPTHTHLIRHEILATIRVAHHFGSAFSREQAYRYLRIPLPRELFDNQLNSFIEAGEIFEDQGLFFEDVVQSHNQRRLWSKAHFHKYRSQLKRLLRLPGIRFAALTGANAFQSCLEKDDVDLFFVTASKRLWLTYFLMVIFTKWQGLRPTFCINFLIDEDHLQIEQQDYFTAVQLHQMIPLIQSSLGAKIIEANPWIYKYLPNANGQLLQPSEYKLRDRGTQWPRLLSPLLDFSNHLIEQFYQRRLSAKYPGEIGKGLHLKPGLAKLNRTDHRDIYQEIYQKIDSEMTTEISS